MRQQFSPTDWAKAAGIGMLTAILLSAVMVPAARLGVSPMPQPLGLAFAETILRSSLPLPVGLLFHVLYVTFWAIIFIRFLRNSFLSALLLGLALWVVVLLVFFPFVGWGLLGLQIGPQLIIGSLIPHLLFALLLWGLTRFLFTP